MGMLFDRTPELFGIVHLCFLAGIAAAVLLYIRLLPRLSEKACMRLLFLSGLLMAGAEVWKQWFIRVYVYPGIRSMWFFPWQLCSMAMYCCLALPFLSKKREAQNAVLTFLSSFSLLAGVMALLVPSDLLRPQVWFLVHGFVYHAVMILQALTAARVLKIRRDKAFLPAMVLFLSFAAVAEVINVIGHRLIPDISHQPNMFFITPYYETTQAVFHEIALKIGIPAEIAVYLILIILGSRLIRLAQTAGDPHRRRAAKK